MAAAEDAVRQDLGQPPGRSPGGRHLPALHRPPARPRDHVGRRRSTGLRMTGRKVRRPDAQLWRAGPQRADHRPRRRDRRRGVAHPGRDPGEQRRRFRPALYRRSTTCARASSTSSGRSRASPSPGMTIVCGDLHTSTHGAFGALAFGIGTSEVEHVLATQTLIQRPAKNMRVTVDGRAAARHHRQGPDPRHHRQDRHRGRHRPRHRICRPGDPRPVDGRPHDRVQHVDRGRRARRPGRAGRDDLRLSQRAGRWRPRARQWEQAVAYWKTLPSDRGRPLRHRGRRSTVSDIRAAGDLGHQPAGRAADHRQRARSRPSADDTAGARSSARWSIWASRPARG